MGFNSNQFMGVFLYIYTTSIIIHYFLITKHWTEWMLSRTEFCMTSIEGLGVKEKEMELS